MSDDVVLKVDIEEDYFIMDAGHPDWSYYGKLGDLIGFVNRIDSYLKGGEE